MDPLEQKLAGARSAYTAIRYRGAALDPARLERKAFAFLPRLAWRPALALAALLAVIVVLVAKTPGPEPAPPAPLAALSFSSAMETLGAARREIAVVPVAPKRPAEGLFHFPASPQRPSRFVESSG